MAQLVKVRDYVSRYEQDLTRYSAQYIRLKRKQWENMRRRWEQGEHHSMIDHLPDEEEKVEEEPTRFQFLKKFLPKKEEIEEQIEEKEEEESLFEFPTTLLHKPKNIQQLHHLFIDQLFHFQMKWASSTLLDESRVDPILYRDTFLRSLVQKVPDNALVFYEPVIKRQKATVELTTIVITPVACYCFHRMEQEDQAVYIGSSERFWQKKSGERDEKILNPLLDLQRTETLLERILQEQAVALPIRKVLVSRNGYIDYPHNPRELTVVDKKSYEDWFVQFSSSASPLKLMQFKLATALLEMSETTAMSRLITEQFDEEVEQ